MGSLGSLLCVYILGGITFLPLILALTLLYVYLTSPSVSPQNSERDYEGARDDLRHPSDDQYSLKSGTDELAEQFHRTYESDVAAGYFAVCREYVPGGVNGKPPERTTPAGEVIAAESPSVYQAMYRSLFDRKQVPSIEPVKGNGKNLKKARNVFYIVLRHGHLMLYDDAHQVEVRHVISLAHHNVSIYGGEGEIQEGELWIKRNAICLSRRLDSLGDLGGPTPPFYLFSENLSEKEDFYFAMLQNQGRMGNSPDLPPKSQQFDVKHIVTLVQRLHSSEEQLQTRWVNAVLGRLFLALYKTPQMEEFVRKKITKKISRVKKPNFVSKIGLQRIDMGEEAPFITNPRLKDLTVDGNCCVEADLQYSGNFRVEISATVRIELGSRFKAREVDLVLAVVLKKLEGHGLLRFKPPPSNRCWISFESMPHMVMDIEPIVSSKQITLGIVLRAIESRIREVVAESIVLPFWDDIPFLDTSSQSFRGGIWEQEIPKPKPEPEIPCEPEEQPPSHGAVEEDPVAMLKRKDERVMSVPTLHASSSTVLKSRRTSKSSIREHLSNSNGTSSAIDKSASNMQQFPPAMRAQTFSNTADPVVTADTAKVDKPVRDSKSIEQSTATSAMIEISSRSPPSSPNRTPNGSPPKDGLITPSSVPQSSGSSINETFKSIRETSVHDSLRRPSSVHVRTSSSSLEDANGASGLSRPKEKPRRRSTLENLTKSINSSSSEEKTLGTLSIGAATAVAKKWGWNMFGKGDHNSNHPNNHSSQEGPRPAGTPEDPIGRGHPFPPPGTPLPTPERFTSKRNHPLPKRKPVPAQSFHEHSKPENKRTSASKPPTPKRKPVANSDLPEGQQHPVELLVVEAPQDSCPNSPATEVNENVDLTKQLSTDDVSVQRDNGSDRGHNLHEHDQDAADQHHHENLIPCLASESAEILSENGVAV